MREKRSLFSHLQRQKICNKLAVYEVREQGCALRPGGRAAVQGGLSALRVWGQPSREGRALPQAGLPASTAWHRQDGGRPHLTPWLGLGEAWQRETWRQAVNDECSSWRGLMAGRVERGPEAWLLTPPLRGSPE